MSRLRRTRRVPSLSSRGSQDLIVDPSWLRESASGCTSRIRVRLSSEWMGRLCHRIRMISSSTDSKQLMNSLIRPLTATDLLPDGPPLKVGMISLGCAKNLVDAEVMLGDIVNQGLEVTRNAEEADVLIVNTCAFIDSAKEESIEAILDAHEKRGLRRRSGQTLIVSGCMSQRFATELAKEMPEVDAFMGLDQIANAGEIVRQVVDPGRIIQGPLNFVTPKSRYIPDYTTPRFRLTPPHFAYLKIAEGCNHPCSFCTIPQMRGAHRSRPQNDILAEASSLLSEGVKELNLISQDSTYYGMDLRPDRSRGIAKPGNFTEVFKSLPTDTATICTLIRELNALPGDFWIRLL